MWTNANCDRPGCTNSRQRTYRDDNGNVLHLCEACYYRMVGDGISGISWGTI